MVNFGFYIILLAIVFLSCKSAIIPCSVIVLQENVRGMPCDLTDKLLSDTNLLNSKMNLSINKLTLTGWWKI